MPQAVQSPSAEVFLRHVLKSGLLGRNDLDAALREAPSAGRNDAEFLADYLIKTGRLTHFQAFKLLRGATVGLVMGPYRILSPLGKGGMGRVYLARDGRNGQLLALKVLPPKKARQEESLRARFQREMSLSQLLVHPHLARCYEAGVHEGIYYIAMEFIPGRSLSQLVKAEGPLTVPRAARLFAEICLGLEHAHGQGLIHRDLKPSNIMITPNDHAKVLDMGLAIVQGEMADDHTIVGGRGIVVGTMDYLAPEQAEDSFNVDARADIYSLGCTLYYVLTGQPPFPGGNAIQKIMRHYSEEPPPVGQVNRAVPAGFSDIVHKMMAKRSQYRYASAADLRRDLLPWASGEPARPPDLVGEKEYREALAETDSLAFSPELFCAEIVAIKRRNDGIADESLPVALPWDDPPPAITIPPTLEALMPLILLALLAWGLLYLFLGK